MADEQKAKPAAEAEARKNRLLVRVGFAGLLILILLAALALFESFTRPTAPPPPLAQQAPSPITPPPAVQPGSPPLVAEPAQEPAAEKAAEVPPAKLPAPPSEVRKADQPRAEPEGTAPPSTAPRAAEARREALAARQAAPHTAVPAKRAEELPAPPVILQTPRPSPTIAAGYVVQMGVFTNLANAEQLRAKLTLEGIPSQIEARVIVGPFMTRQEAVAAQAKLKATGLDAGMLISYKSR